ncbi:MAG: monovalent cation/H+ antiporter complex subunit F [Methanosarcinales archaeon]
MDITLLFKIISITIIITTLLCLYRGVYGPEMYNRLVAINTIGTKTIVILVLIGFIYERPFFFDIALVYALLNFIGTLAISKYVETGRLDI